jgi:hypothetical protein
MLRLGLIAAVVAVLTTAMATAAEARTAPPRIAPSASVARPAPVLAAFRSRFGFGSRSRYGYRYGSRYGYRYGYGRRSPSLLHRVVKTAIWLYILHLFFAHGGLSIVLWIIIIGFVLSLVRRHRRRSAYRVQSFWR